MGLLTGGCCHPLPRAAVPVVPACHAPAILAGAANGEGNFYVYTSKPHFPAQFEPALQFLLVIPEKPVRVTGPRQLFYFQRAQLLDVCLGCCPMSGAVCRVDGCILLRHACHDQSCPQVPGVIRRPHWCCGVDWCPASRGGVQSWQHISLPDQFSSTCDDVICPSRAICRLGHVYPLATVLSCFSTFQVEPDVCRVHRTPLLVVPQLC